LAFNVIAAPPAKAEFNLLPLGIVRPVFVTVVFSKIELNASCVLSCTEVATIIGRSYGADGRDVGGVYRMVVVVVVPEVVFEPAASVPHEFVPIFAHV